MLVLWMFFCFIIVSNINAQYGYRAIYRNGYFVDVQPGSVSDFTSQGYDNSMGQLEDSENTNDKTSHSRSGAQFLNAKGSDNRLTPFSDAKLIRNRAHLRAGPPGLQTDIFIADHKTTNAQDLKSAFAEQERIRTDVTFNKKKVKVMSDEARIAQLSSDTTDQLNINTTDKIPLPDCFINERGFLCCNRDLLELINDANRYVVAKRYSECNTQIFARTLQKKAEKKFDITFEIIVSTGDFASKSHIRDNFICKDRINRRFILIYATPASYTIGKENEPLLEINTLNE